MTTETTVPATRSVTLSIAAAQREIATAKKRLGDHVTRAAGALETREGDDTFTASPFDFASERKALEAAYENLIRLKAARTLANARHSLTFRGTPMKVAEAVIRLAETRSRLAWLRGLAIRDRKERVSATASARPGRRSSWRDDDESSVVPGGDTVLVTYTSALSERDRTAQVDALQAEIDELNRELEAANGRARFTVTLLA